MIETATKMKNAAATAEFDKYQKLRAFVGKGIKEKAENGDYYFSFVWTDYQSYVINSLTEELKRQGYETHQKGANLYVYWR